MNTINQVFYAAIERNLDRQMLFKQTKIGRASCRERV